MIRPNRSHPLNAGRQSWWLALPGIVGNGNVLADIWGSNPAYAITPTMPIAGLGPFGAAAHYDGSTQYARASCPTLTAFTAVAWAKFDNFTGATILKNWGETIAGYMHWDASTAGSGVVRAYVNSTSGGGGNVTAGNTLTAGTAYRLAVTAGGGNLALYCNGVSVGTGTYAGTLSSTLAYLAFGAKLDDAGAIPAITGAAYLAGTMGDVGLWNRALSATEIAQFDAEMRAGYPNLLIRDRPTVALFQQRGRFQRIGMDGGFPAYAGGF